MTRFRALLIGLGQIGCGYDAHLPFAWDQPYSSASTLSHARALACHPGFELVGGVDPSPTACDRFAGLYHLPTYVDLSAWRIASTGPDPDVVVIAVPPQLQPALVEQLLCLMRPRLLLLEKPVAASLDEGHALERACARQPEMVVAVNYIRRYLPSVQSWLQRLQAGDLGKLLFGRIIYGKGLLTNGSHFVNLAEAWLGQLTLGHLLDRGLTCFEFDREASLELHVQAHHQAPLQVRSVGSSGLRAGELDLWFRGGRLCWRNDGQTIAFWPRQPPASCDSHSPLASVPEIMFTGIEHYQLSVVDSLSCLLRDPTRAPLLCSLSDGMRTLEILSHCL
jgi:hypothetical protein